MKKNAAARAMVKRRNKKYGKTWVKDNLAKARAARRGKDSSRPSKEPTTR